MPTRQKHVTFADFVSIPSPEIPVGGRLKYFQSEWRKITSDVNILKAIAGFEIPLVDFQQQGKLRFPLKFSETEMRAADEEIQKLLNKNAIMECSEGIVSGDFVSPVFLRPKKQGGVRLILDLSDFNDFVEYAHFKVETIRDILAAVVPNCYMAVGDLQDAYLVLPIDQQFWHLLKFQWRKKVYCYKVLCFGLACSPRIFTKVAKVPLSVVRSKGHVAFMYLDDGFLMGLTFQDCWNCISCYLQTFTALGFLPHPEKCMLWPSRTVSILGFIIDSVSMTVTISVDKMVEIHDLCIFAMQKPRMSVRQLCRLIGKLISVMLAIPLGQAHYKRLEFVKVSALRANGGDFDSMCEIPKYCFPDLVWWTDHIFQAKAPIRRPAPHVELFTDSSAFGWGSALFSYRSQGRFLPDEQNLSINTKECLAIYYRVCAFLPILRNKHVCIRSDSMCAVSSANKMGSCSSRVRDLIMRDLWTLCTENNMWLTAVHIRGIFNTAADRSSRMFNNKIMWTLPQVHFNKIRLLYPDIDVDLFSSYNTARLEKFVSWKPDPFAWAVDAFSLDWSQFKLPYIFAPNSVNMRVFQQLRRDQCSAVIVVPVWPMQPWWGTFLQCLTDFPQKIPQEPSLFLPWDPTAQHPCKNMCLVIAKVSGIEQRMQVFRQKLRNIWQCTMWTKHKQSMDVFSFYGKNFVVDNLKIPISPL